jgi:four helix bundle protein
MAEGDGEAMEVYRLAVLLPREETYGTRSQITRAAVSLPANIAEGWTRESRREKAQFMAVAQGSLAETETLLTLCEEIGWFPTSKTQALRGLLVEVRRCLPGFVSSFEQSPKHLSYFLIPSYFTVTLLARFLGLSGSWPRRSAR